MSRRTLLGLAGGVLLVAAATAINTPYIVWNLPWPVRLGIGAAGVLLLLGALLVDRSPSDRPGRNVPSA